MRMRITAARARAGQWMEDMCRLRAGDARLVPGGRGSPGVSIMR